MSHFLDGVHVLALMDYGDRLFSFSAPMIQEVVLAIYDAVNDAGIADCLFQVIV